MDAEDEETKFLRVLDLLEEQDEFLSASDASVLDDDEEDDDESEAGEPHVTNEDEASEEDAEENPDWIRLAADWGPLEAWELAAAMMELRQRRIPAQDVCARILRDLCNLYSTSPNVVHLSRQSYDTRLVVVGDLHGHFGDLMHILEENGDPTPGPGGTSYLFNGDFVDRGMWGPEVLLLIYCLKLTYPALVHLNRGNHEDEQQNKQGDNGFSNQHCMRAWKHTGRMMYALCRRSFKMLPLVHVVDNQVAVMHGGLSLDSGVTLAEINSIERKHRVPVFSCNLLGYPRNQAIRARRALEAEMVGIVPAGTPGKLLRQVHKTQTALARFQGGGEVEVHIAGAPELEPDIDIVYESEALRRKFRNDRIFVGLLWSDPVPAGRSKPSRRGVGWNFDADVTRNFLLTNNLRCMLRSHEKQKNGFQLEHVCPKMGALAGTVFSASNYPTGAGEPAGNQAAVLVLTLPKQTQAMTLPLAVPAWREPYLSSTSRWDGSNFNGTMLTKLQNIEYQQQLGQTPQDEDEPPPSARVRVVKKLRSMIYCARPALLAMWNRIDKDCTGTVNLKDWASAMRACVVPDEEFPWEWIARYIAHIDKNNGCRYADFLGRYENKLLRRLSQRWHGGALTQLAPGITTLEEAERAWEQVDRDGNGKLTYLELRPLLRMQAGGSGGTVAGKKSNKSTNRDRLVEFNSMADDDRVYSVLQNLDQDRSGFVDREEFVKAVVEANRRKSLFEAAQELPACSRPPRKKVFVLTEDEDESDEAMSSEDALVTKRPSQILDQHLWTVGNDTAIVQCWVATHSALRSLAAARCSVETVFEALDVDNDGDIDRAEFREGLTQLIHDQSLLNSMDQWEPLLWRLVDEDESTRVSHKELADLLEIRDVLSL